MSALLSLNEQLVTVGLLLSLCIPPPRVPAVFPVNVQLVTVGLLLSLYIPPPLLSGGDPLALPPVMVKPSSIVSGPSSLTHCTTWKSPVPSMTVTSGPSALRNVIALPRKSMASK